MLAIFHGEICLGPNLGVPFAYGILWDYFSSKEQSEQYLLYVSFEFMVSIIALKGQYRAYGYWT